MEQLFYIDLILSEIVKTNQVDYQFLENSLGLSSVTVVHLIEHMKDEGTIHIDPNGKFSVSGYLDVKYYQQLYSIAHRTQNKKSAREPDFNIRALEIYIPEDFAE